MVLGVVYHGERFVEVPDASVTLKDISAAFGIEGDLSGVCIKSRVSGRVVMTLPFETLPTAATLRDDEDHTYVLLTPADLEAGEGEPTTENMTDILKQLLQLGASTLLAAQSDSQASLDLYDPRLSPGLLMRTVYPPSIYSPYRYSGDPLKHSGRLATSATAVPQASGPLYVSTLEPYTVEKLSAATLKQRTDLVPQSEEDAQDILQGLVAAATQARVMVALSDSEGGRNAPLDVKPNIYLPSPK